MPTSDFPNVPTGEYMTAEQMLTLTVLERTGGCISLVAVLAIFIAYGLLPEVRNVQNTFIAFASVSNIGASIASSIAMDGLLLGKESSLCQAQSFMFEMFMQSDPWWSLAMSINVFLVFFFRASPDAFQKWWWLYCLICYGGPLTIALVLLLIRNHPRGLVYGEATIWCWVDREWDDIRIYTYYMLIWICILGSLFFYFLVGWHVFRSRNRLRSFSTNRSQNGTQNDDSSRIKLPRVPREGFYGTVITEVQIVHSNASPAVNSNGTSPLSFPAEPKRAHLPSVSFDECTHTKRGGQCICGDSLSNIIRPVVSNNQYAATVTATETPTPSSPKKPASRFARFWKSTKRFLGKFVVADPIKSAYLRTSFLFAFSVLVTWIPSSMNRIHSWLTGESPYEYHIATAAVLPLQGLWNAVIFFVTSNAAIRKGWVELQQRRLNAGGGWTGLLAACNLRKKDTRGMAAAAAAAATSRNNGFRGGDGFGSNSNMAMAMARRSNPIDHDLEGNSSDGDVGTLEGSVVELRRMVEAPGKSSSSSTL